MSPLRLLLLATPCALLPSCVPAGSAPTAAPVAAARPKPFRSRDIARLGQLITLPRRPTAVVWQHLQRGDGDMGPSDYFITAVLQFSPRDAQALTQSAMRRRRVTRGEISVQPWFPDALKNRAKNNILKAQELDPSDFFKLSFLQGSLHRVEGTPYFVLSLHTA